MVQKQVLKWTILGSSSLRGVQTPEMTYFGPLLGPLLDPSGEVLEGPVEQDARIECPKGILKGILGQWSSGGAPRAQTLWGPLPEGPRNDPFWDPGIMIQGS